MNNCVPSAEMSPRIVNGVTRWYAGDTFEWQIHFDLRDQDGEPITIAETDTVNVKFLNRSESLVKEFSFDNIEDNTVSMDFDTTCTALFPKGNYTYDIYYSNAYRTTMANDNKVVVE